jgi:hypothetical protein
MAGMTMTGIKRVAAANRRDSSEFAGKKSDVDDRRADVAETLPRGKIGLESQGGI